MSETKDIYEKLHKIEDNLANLNEKIDHITQLLENDVAKNCNKMNQHINFIENVYQTVKSPLGFICQKVNYAVGHNNYTLEHDT